MAKDSARGASGMFAGDDEGGDPQELTIAEGFWLPMGRNYRTHAKQIAAWLDVPPVVLSAYSFEMEMVEC